MNRTPVSSSYLKSVGYDPATATLEVEFADGKVFHYSQVPLSTYDGLINASSPGKYFTANIRGRSFRPA